MLPRHHPAHSATPICAIERRGRWILSATAALLPLLAAIGAWQQEWKAAAIVFLWSLAVFAIIAKIGTRPMAQMLGTIGAQHPTLPNEEGLRRFLEGAAIQHGLTSTICVTWTIGHTRKGYAISTLDAPMPTNDALLSHIYAHGKSLCALTGFGTQAFEQTRTWTLELGALSAHERLERVTTALQTSQSWTG